MPDALPTPLPKPRTLPETVRRRRILDAARRVLVRSGYGDVSLDDVARRADVAKGTLYLYFKDKDDLLAAVLGDLIGRLQEKLERAPACDGSPEALRRLADVHLGFVERYHDFFTQLVPSRRMLSTKTGRTINDRFSIHLQCIAHNWIRPCIDSGMLRRHDPLLGALFFVSLIRLFMVRRFVRNDKAPLRRNARQLVSLFTNGMGAGRRRAARR